MIVLYLGMGWRCQGWSLALGGQYTLVPLTLQGLLCHWEEGKLGLQLSWVRFCLCSLLLLTSPEGSLESTINKSLRQEPLLGLVRSKPIILTLRKEENLEFKASLGYMTPCLKANNNNNNKLGLKNLL